MYATWAGDRAQHRDHELAQIKSSASGNERLVLLALADACSRDDGTGAGRRRPRSPARRNISNRTVRRMISRLEAEGHLIVHRGGGAGAGPVTNPDTVVTGATG
jgi:hypothetical protein